jgi:signal peptidase II
MPSRMRLGLIILVVLTLDQATKYLISAHLSPGDSIAVVPGFFHLTLVRNSGMAFGLLSAAAIPYKPVLVTLLSIVALGAVAIYAASSPANERLSQFALAFILGGAAGNIIDRIRLGYVVDFLDVFYRGSHWPAFNVADSAICAGVGLLLIDTLLRPAKSPAEAGAGDR